MTSLGRHPESGCEAPRRATARVRLPHRWRWRGVAVLAGALPALAFPEADQWWLAYVGLVPIMVLVVRAPTGREAGLRAWAGGAGFVVALHHWLIPNIGPFMVPTGLLLGALWIPWGRIAWGLLARPPTPGRVAAALVLVPSAWVAAEFVRSWGSLGGAFGLLGSSQWQTRSVLSLASLGGVWLVSMVVVAIDVALTISVLAGARAGVRLGALGAAAALAGVGPLWWVLRDEPRPTRTLRVAGVQAGVIHPVGPRFDASEATTLAMPPDRFDLVVWGESSVGLDPRRHPRYQERIERASRTVGADVLVNVDVRRGPGGILKRSVLVGPAGTRARYDKQRLVPFGEYIPLRPLFSWLEAVTRAPAEDRQRGGGTRIFETAGIRLGPLICFESAFPDLTRRLVRQGADLVVVQSATWAFQGSWAPEHHASLAAVRAVESGRSVLHATLTGVSAAFDATGERLVWFPTDRRGRYTVDVPITRGMTPYVRFGDWVPAMAFAALFVAALVGGVRAARRASIAGVDANRA